MFFYLVFKPIFCQKLSYLIRVAIFSTEPTILDLEIFIIFFLGMNLIDWVAIVTAIIFQGFLFSVGMNMNKKIIIFSAITVYLGILLFFLSVLLLSLIHI